MTSSLKASSDTAGSIVAKYRFEIPSFQREYSWEKDDVADFWLDLKSSSEEDETDSYFLGLIILTRKGEIMSVVDGQQRLVTLALLAKALFNKAKKLDRTALADKIESSFLLYLNYETDETVPRISFVDKDDNATFRLIIESESEKIISSSSNTVSERMIKSFNYLNVELNKYLQNDEFRLLGKLTEFIMDKLHFAAFTSEDDASAYKIFEVINTRGRALTTADLLKNYIISKSGDDEKKIYEKWNSISKEFSDSTSKSTLVQYIKHAVSVDYGHIPAKDLYDVLSGKKRNLKSPPTPFELLDLLSNRLDIYRQIDNPEVFGSSERSIEGRALDIFSAFNSLNVHTVRPVLLSLCEIEGGEDGMEYLLRLVVRRMVVGNIGVGIVERQFGDAARRIHMDKDWKFLKTGLVDFDQTREEFIDRLLKRSFNKRTLKYVRSSALQGITTPRMDDHLHWIWQMPPNWASLTEEHTYCASTLGNSFLARTSKRPRLASESWDGFKMSLLNEAAEVEIADKLKRQEVWDVKKIEMVGREVAEMAAQVWY